MINKENKVKLCYILLKLQKPKKINKAKEKCNKNKSVTDNNYKQL